jgi:hypothetical protein
MTVAMKTAALVPLPVGAPTVHPLPLFAGHVQRFARP